MSIKINSDSTLILMNSSLIDEKWSFPFIKPYLKSTDKVCILALSFFEEDAPDAAAWQKEYGKPHGTWHAANTKVFKPFGIQQDQIEWVNPYEDRPSEMAEKIKRSNILMLPGGAPDQMMKRIRKYRLKKLIQNYKGVIIGYSAGAMIQFDKYHITPDMDYPEFSWHDGLGLIEGFDIEAHYKELSIQKKSIERAVRESQKPVYAVFEEGGIIAQKGKPLQFFGRTELFEETDF